VRALDRAWKILLKGIPEVEASERPLAAAEMVLVRLTHAATLPMPEDLMRMIAGQGTDPSAGATGGSMASVPPGMAAPASIAQRADAGATEMRSPPGEGTLRMQASNGSPSGMARPAAEVPGQAAPALEIGRFEDLVLLAEQKREIRLKTMLRTNVRLVSFRDGRMEFNLAGNPPQSFVSDLGQKLLQWTGKRWTITVSREGGAPTLDEVEKAELGQRSEMARADPVVEAVLSRFPGSRIVDVKMREELAQPAAEEIGIAEGGEEDAD
jgi:DNA polymerase-3 subunit gamma/tau